jgi:hypothetical protein
VIQAKIHTNARVTKKNFMVRNFADKKNDFRENQINWQIIEN